MRHPEAPRMQRKLFPVGGQRCSELQGEAMDEGGGVRKGGRSGRELRASWWEVEVSPALCSPHPSHPVQLSAA